MITLKELAERTGYSPATISRILNRDPSLSVTPEARRKVLEEAGKTNYAANRSRRGRTPKILLRIGVAEMLTPSQQLDDPYYLYLSNYLRQGCLDRKYAAVPLEARGEVFFQPEGEALDGIIAIGLFTEAQIESLAAINPNVVFLDSSPFDSRFDSVVLNYELGISAALEHLHSLGHQRIAFVGPSFKLNDRRQRAPEIRQQLFQKLTGGTSQNHPLIDCPMEMDATLTAVFNFLKTVSVRPTAFLCANEEGAIGTLYALSRAGISVPGEVSVVSFNDTPRSALVTPPLTSVSTHVQEMANIALRLVAERAVSQDKPAIRTLPIKVVVPPSLVIRDSTGPAAE